MLHLKPYTANEKNRNEKDSIKKKKAKPQTTLTNIVAKVFKYALANQIQQYIKQLHTTTYKELQGYFNFES